MEIQTAIELIEKSGHIAIVFPPNASLDCLASAEVLYGVLQRKEKRVGFLGSQNEILRPRFARAQNDMGKIPSQNDEGVFRTLNDKERTPRLPREFIISVNASESPIAELRYEKSGDALDIILSPKSAPITDKNVSFREGKMLCDCAILIGVADPETLNGSLGIEPDFFDKTPLVNIDVSSHNKLYGEVNLVDNTKIALAEIVYELATALNAEPLDKGPATLLLAAIFEKTGGLQTSVSADTLMAASELLRLGARKEEAMALAKEPAPVELLQFFGRASVRSKLENERGILWSFLTAEDFEKTGRSAKDVPRVLRHLEKSFPPHQLRALLWQDSREGTVNAAFAGNRELLEKLNERAPSKFQSPDLRLTASFNSFREGEGYISALLKELI